MNLLAFLLKRSQIMMSIVALFLVSDAFFAVDKEKPSDSCWVIA